MSSPIFDDTRKRTIIAPNIYALNQVMMSVHQRDRARFGSFDSYYNNACIDSAKAQADVHIMNIVRSLRSRIKRDEADTFIVLYGTDTMADFVTALGFGVSKKELGDKSIIVTGAMQNVEITNTDAFRNFQRSVALALLKEEIRGKIGLCFNDRFFPPRRLQKIQRNRKHPFASGFRRMAKYNIENELWHFDREPAPYDEPRGVEGEDFRLVSGVERIGLTATSDYKNLPDMVKGLAGVVLEAPGNGNLRDGPKDIAAIKKTVTAAKGLLVVVGEAVQNQDDDDELLSDNDWSDVAYRGDATLFEGRLMAGNQMSESEARILLSHWIAEARHRKLKQADVTHFVAEQFALYPFKSADACGWTDKKREGNGGNH